MSTRYVYALIDVRDDSVRYIGVTKDTFARFDQHMVEAGRETPKGLWLSELQELGLYPRLEILETVTGTRRAALERERYWTVKFVRLGAPLVNVTAVNNPFPLQFDEEATIVELRRDLGWSQNELARRARLNPNTVRKAENGEPISGQTATAIAEAFSEAFGKRILVRDIEELNVTI